MLEICPNCGKPVRKGGKFCGFCGYVISREEPGTPRRDQFSQAEITHPSPRPVSLSPEIGDTCPHCGKENRVGVKFCTNCGNKLSRITTPLKPPTPIKRTPRKRSRFLTISLFAAGLVGICAALLALAYGLGFIDRFFPTGTPVVTMAVAEVDTSTPDLFTPLPSATVAPTETDFPTVTVTPTETPPPTLTDTPIPEVVFEDDFLEGLINWLPLGTEPGSNGDDSFPSDLMLGDFLNLKGQGFDDVGITSLQTITLTAGMVIQFDADVGEPLKSPLFFDWNPGEDVRPSNELGPFYLEITNSEVRFHYQKNGTGVDCQVTTQQEGIRSYRIIFNPGWVVITYVEDEELCRASMDVPDPLFGRFTFSGSGLVNRIEITLLPE